jgi:hypothetical protein
VTAERVGVCKKFFLNALDVGKKTVTFAMQNKQHVLLYTDKPAGFLLSFLHFSIYR